MGDQIMDWMREQGRAVLFSEVTQRFGLGAEVHLSFNRLIRDDHVRSCFPEAKPGHSGRQFWEIVAREPHATEQREGDRP